jgi:dipeptidyl aminopeptidase/acylaminoacyl peptidase
MMLGVMDKADGLDDVGEHRDQSSKVQAVVSFFGPADFTQEFPPDSRNLVRDFLGGTQPEKPDAHRKASPITYVDKSDAPLLIFQGTKDILVPHSQSLAMAEAMTRFGAAGRVELLVGAGHSWGGPEIQRTLAATSAFFDQHLKAAAKAETPPAAGR